ncbi:hypothetical protein FA15DRAFT_591588 [Coprinopsis marcescibilis]|uniref:Uncharacterized protein n=1 Tax=Coprinopsis marcescibilis TaxID=230819 RepID=A0A5C3KWG5_COPMA|nr:hypothetical protein FA15DRAFT_591588 [Coprinopsis marcescibilis]
MGKSAKLHKRVKKTKSGSNTNSAIASTQVQAQAAKKKTTLKDKSSKSKSENREGPVLGGADYVALMMGGRRKAKAEAAKLPTDDSDMS